MVDAAALPAADMAELRLDPEDERCNECQFYAPRGFLYGDCLFDSPNVTRLYNSYCCHYRRKETNGSLRLQS
jgi:hypothetical protein